MVRKPGGQSNAFKQGAFTRHQILPDESGDEFKLLHQGLREEWKPSGALEEDTVLTIAQCIWLKRGVERFYYWEATWAQEHPGDAELQMLAKKLDEAQTFEDATEVISKLPEVYKKWVERITPQSQFKDGKS